MDNKLTFFSATDTSTLLSEGSDINHFVSLIVNNAGVYTAGITRRVSVVQKVSEEYTYPSWKDTTKSGTREFTATKTYIQWFNLEVNKEEVVKEDESEILDRIKEVRRLKASKPKFQSPYVQPTYITKAATTKLGPSEDLPPSNLEVVSKNNPTTKVKENPKTVVVTPSLFEQEDEEDFNIDYNAYHFTEHTITNVVKQLITLSLVLPNSEVIDVVEWAKNMEEIFDERFESVIEFESVAVNIIDYLLNYTDEEDAYIFLSPRAMVAVLANDVKDALSKLPENKYINSLISMCDDYIF